MSRYTPKVTQQFEFDGDTVTVEFNRLKRKHLLVLSPHMTDDADKLTFEDQVKFTEVAAEIMPECVISMTGLTDIDGNTISIETVTEDAYFVKLVSDIMGAIMSHSFMSEDEAKN